MTFTPVSPLIRVTRLDTNHVLGTSTNVESLEIVRGLDGEETLSVTLSYGPNDPTDAAFALITASGGADGTGPIWPVLLELSLDGGTNVDARKMVEQPLVTLDQQQGALLQESGQGLWAGYAQTLVDHVTFTGITFADYINGAAGALTFAPAPAAPPNPVTTLGIGTPEILSHLKGLLQTQPGPPFSVTPAWLGQNKMKFAVHVDSSIGSLYIDADEYASPIDKAVQTAVSAASGVQAGSDAIGLHAHYVVDSSDTGAGNMVTGVDGVTYGGSLSVGVAGTASGLTFSDQTNAHNPALAPDNSKAPVVDPVQRQVILSDLEASTTVLGGISNHGLPDAASITGAVVINTGVGGTAWNASLPLIAAHDAQGGGGVYFLVEGYAYPASQQLTVNDLTVDTAAGTPYMYAATESGVYRSIAQLTGTASPPEAQLASAYASRNWERIGGNTTAGATTPGLVAACRRVIAQNGVILTHAYKGNVTGIFMHPIATGNTHGTKGGYDGWSAIHCVSDPTSATLIDFGYLQAHDEIAIVEASSATVVTLYTGVATNTLVKVGAFETLNGASITGIDTVYGGYIIRTLQGADGLYFLETGGASIGAIGTGLVTAQNNTAASVIVNSVVGVPGAMSGSGSSSGGATIYGLACTDGGVFYSTTALSLPTWKFAGLQTGTGDQNVLHAVMGAPRTLINRTTTCAYAATDRTLLVSNSDELYFEDVLADKVDLTAFWLVLAQNSASNTGHAYAPATDIIAFANAADIGVSGGLTTIAGAYVGTPGTAWSLPSAFPLPTGFAWVSPLDERNNRTYRLTNFTSAAPYFGINAGEVPEIEASSSSDAVTAATRLAQVQVRRAKEYTRAQHQLTLVSGFAYVESALRTLRPTQHATVTCDLTAWGIAYSGVTFYVLRQRLYWARGDQVVHSESTLGTILRNTTPATYSQLAATQGYATGKLARYGRTPRV